MMCSSDKWLPSLHGGRFSPTPPIEDMMGCVANWRMEDGTGWKVEELSNLIMMMELDAIKSVICSESWSANFLMLIHTKSGELMSKARIICKRIRVVIWEGLMEIHIRSYGQEYGVLYSLKRLKT